MLEMPDMNNPRGNDLFRAPVGPVWLSPGDDRRLRDVFEKPYVAFIDPNAVKWKKKTLPTVPGSPVTTGLEQVCYDDQAMWDRSKVDQAGPVRAFFRCLMGKKNKIVQA
jgi:hypothetical protein